MGHKAPRAAHALQHEAYASRMAVRARQYSALQNIHGVCPGRRPVIRPNSYLPIAFTNSWPPFLRRAPLFKFLGAWKIRQTALCGACHASLQPWPQDILLTVRHAPSAVLVTRKLLSCVAMPPSAAWPSCAQDVFSTSLGAKTLLELSIPVRRPNTHGLCDVAEDVCVQRGLSLGSAKPVLARAFRQPRGRLRPQLIPEFVKVVSHVLRAMPALDAKRCITARVRDAPAGSKLLRSENRGSSGFFCVFWGL